MSNIQDALASVSTVLASLETKYALVGGLAVSVRAEPRFTRDIDLAIAVQSDEQAEHLIYELQNSGLQVFLLIEQEETNRLATVRFNGLGEGGIVVDALFASSGIETEVVTHAQTLEVFTDVHVPVAQVGHLLALKILSTTESRPQDRIDITSLHSVASAEEIQRAKDSLTLISQRGYARGRDLQSLFDQLIAPE